MQEIKHTLKIFWRQTPKPPFLYLSPQMLKQNLCSCMEVINCVHETN